MADKRVRPLLERFTARFGGTRVIADAVKRTGSKCAVLLEADDLGIHVHDTDTTFLGQAADFNDPGNGMIALHDAAGGVIVWVKQASARLESAALGTGADELGTATAREVVARSIPDWLKIESGGAILRVDDIPVAREFFRAIGAEIPLGTCFRITQRDADHAVAADPVPELDAAAVQDLREQFDDLVRTIGELLAPGSEGNELPVDTVRRVAKEFEFLRKERAASVLHVSGSVGYCGGGDGAGGGGGYGAFEHVAGVAIQSVAHPGGGDGTGPELESGNLSAAAIEDAPRTGEQLDQAADAEVDAKPEGGAA